MKIKITPEIVYTVDIEGTTHSGFKQVDKWEGMLKLERGNQAIIVDTNESSFDEFLNKFLGNTDEKEVSVIKISPELIPTVIK